MNVINTTFDIGKITTIMNITQGMQIYIKQFMLTVLCSFFAFTTWADEQPTLVIDVPFIELHSGPADGYPVVFVIEKDEPVTVLLKRTSWFKVKDKRGNEGWFHENKLTSLTLNGELLSANVIEQQYSQRTWEGGVMYGDFEGANYYDVSLGFVFNPVISAEVSLGKALGDFSDSDLYEMTLYAQPFPELLISPYIGVGGGLIKTKPHGVLADSKNRDDTLMSAAIGAKYHLARNFILRAEYKHSLILTDRDDNEEIKIWKVGFSVFF